MAAGRVLTPQGSGRGRGAGDDRIRLLAAFPDVDWQADPPAAIAAVLPERPDRLAMPRVGWGSIAILLIVAAASCTAAFWVDRGPIDPGAVEIERARIAERPAVKSPGVLPQKMTRRR